ncbi:MAG: hypothetical protein SNH94_01035 [Rikenellaceae bacterium]
MRYLLSVIYLLLAVVSASAAEPNSIIGDVIDKLDRMSPYRVQFEVEYGKNRIGGLYEVADENYYISIDEQELFGDSKVKYEVFNSRKEVLIDAVSPDYDGNLLSNPAVAFSSIRDHYTSKQLSDDGVAATFELTPSAPSVNPIETIELTINSSTILPERIVYNLGGEKVVVKVVSIEKLTSSITSYNIGNYLDYEVIDFR